MQIRRSELPLAFELARSNNHTPQDWRAIAARRHGRVLVLVGGELVEQDDPRVSDTGPEAA